MPKFTCEPFGNTVALPTVVTFPVFVFILDPDTAYLNANVGVPVFKFVLDPVKVNNALPTIVGSPVDTFN